MRVNVNRVIALVLAIGVIASLVILLWGSALYLAKTGFAPMHPAAGPHRPGSALGLLRGAIALDPIATINLGLLVLLLTPVVRVIAAMVAFSIERDRKYALISLAVLVILAVSAEVGR